MYTRNALALSTALLLSACEKMDDTGDTGTDDTAETTPALTPLEGPWYSENEATVKDTCSFFDDDKDTKKSTPVNLTMIDESTFTLIDKLDPDGLNLTCNLDTTSGVFDCGTASTTDDLSKDGTEAVLTFSQSLAGTLASPSTGSIVLGLAVSCEGEDCELLAKKGFELPCSMERTADIYHGG